MTSNLASLLFGAYRRDVLALLLLHPDLSLHVREIARVTGKVPGTLLRELNRLADAGLLVRKPIGNQVRYEANPASPVYQELRGILKKTAGVADVLREALEPIASRVRAAFVYGSVARGDERAASDLDVMVVGELKFVELVQALSPASVTLRREVNPSLYSPDEFRSKRATEPFLKRVLADKKIFLIGGEDDLAEPRPDRKAKAARR